MPEWRSRRRRRPTRAATDGNHLSWSLLYSRQTAYQRQEVTYRWAPRELTKKGDAEVSVDQKPRNTGNVCASC
jgi:hypothetical protein